VEGLPHGAVTTRVGEFEYSHDAGCFFQGHRGLLPRLVEAVLGDPDAGGGELAVDLYAGVGLFTLPLARRFERVVAVEGDRLAARYGKINARRNRANNVAVVHRAVESWVRELPEVCDRVVVDPPRTGLAPAVTAALTGRPPRAVTYVSCHPAALARDLVLLAPTFEVREVILVDLFPQTGHIEAVVRLEAR
jgi:23S rRNA (uracil1939-C5)-methyltransferase